jgi:hypothetical protein
MLFKIGDIIYGSSNGHCPEDYVVIGAARKYYHLILLSDYDEYVYYTLEDQQKIKRVVIIADQDFTEINFRLKDKSSEF